MPEVKQAYHLTAERPYSTWFDECSDGCFGHAKKAVDKCYDDILEEYRVMFGTDLKDRQPHFWGDAHKPFAECSRHTWDDGIDRHYMTVFNHNVIHIVANFPVLKPFVIHVVCQERSFGDRYDKHEYGACITLTEPDGIRITDQELFSALEEMHNIFRTNMAQIHHDYFRPKSMGWKIKISPGPGQEPVLRAWHRAELFPGSRIGPFDVVNGDLGSLLRDMYPAAADSKKKRVCMPIDDEAFRKDEVESD